MHCARWNWLFYHINLHAFLEKYKYCALYKVELAVLSYQLTCISGKNIRTVHCTRWNWLFYHTNLHVFLEKYKNCALYKVELAVLSNQLTCISGKI